uniref:Uncharacterized protein n=1 Tax=Arundo donax TaxID=35708 RepID=A0A0A9DSH4_ARUDO
MKQNFFGPQQVDFHHFVEKKPIPHSNIAEAMVKSPTLGYLYIGHHALGDLSMARSVEYHLLWRTCRVSPPICIRNPESLPFHLQNQTWYSS